MLIALAFWQDDPGSVGPAAKSLPDVGSSRKRTLGLATKAMPTLVRFSCSTVSQHWYTILVKVWQKEVHATQYEPSDWCHLQDNSGTK